MGKRFKRWQLEPSGTEIESGSLESETLKIKMGVKNVSAAAEFADTYTINVTSGSAAPTEAEAGEKITITAAAAAANRRFTRWTITPSVAFTSGSATSTSATFTMPAQNVTATANYESVYDVTVTSGTASPANPVPVSSTVTLTANDAPSNYVFDKWDISPSNLLANANVSPATFAMPASNVTAAASYKDDRYVDGIERHPDEGGPNPHNYAYENIGGKRYPTVRIGNQIWMAENLGLIKVGIQDIIGTLAWNDGYNPYEQHEELLKRCGAYHHEETVQRLNGMYKIPGWHLPSEAEWKELIAFAGGSSGGRHLRSKEYWTGYDGHPLDQGTDRFGFNALPAGQRRTPTGYSPFSELGNLGIQTTFWVSGMVEVTNAGGTRTGAGIARFYSSSSAADIDITAGFEYSVRLVKDA